MMELEQLRQLVAFAEQGTLSRAAEELHISQPSLSRTMQALEEELQASLFIRQKNYREERCTWLLRPRSHSGSPAAASGAVRRRGG